MKKNRRKIRNICVKKLPGEMTGERNLSQMSENKDRGQKTETGQTTRSMNRGQFPWALKNLNPARAEKSTMKVRNVTIKGKIFEKRNQKVVKKSYKQKRKRSKLKSVSPLAIKKPISSSPSCVRKDVLKRWFQQIKYFGNGTKDLYSSKNECWRTSKKMCTDDARCKKPQIG